MYFEFGLVGYVSFNSMRKRGVSFSENEFTSISTVRHIRSSVSIPVMWQVWEWNPYNGLSLAHLGSVFSTVLPTLLTNRHWKHIKLLWNMMENFIYWLFFSPASYGDQNVPSACSLLHFTVGCKMYQLLIGSSHRDRLKCLSLSEERFQIVMHQLLMLGLPIAICLLSHGPHIALLPLSSWDTVWLKPAAEDSLLPDDSFVLLKQDSEQRGKLLSLP